MPDAAGRSRIWVGNRSEGEAMPHYEYRCQECKKKFSLLLTVEEHERRRPKCPHCGSTKIEQQWAAFFAVTGKKS